MNVQDEQNRPLGFEMRLTGIPYGMPAAVVKATLARDYLVDFPHNFMVIFEQSAEDFFWKSFGDPRNDHTRSARLIIPLDENGNNPGADLAGHTVVIRDNNVQVDLQAEPAKNILMSNEKFKELRRENLSLPLADGIRDGQVGRVLSVSCGRFNEDGLFETHYTWRPSGEPDLGPFNYFGDVQPKKFTCGLTEVTDEWEYMDLYSENINGLIFERPVDPNQHHRVAYFVVDKPPQFYEYTPAEGYEPDAEEDETDEDEDEADIGDNEAEAEHYEAHPEVREVEAEGLETERRNLNDHEDQEHQGYQLRHVHSRIQFPSMPYLYKPNNRQHRPNLRYTSIPTVNWAIQWSRVYKIQYAPIQEFDFASYHPRMSEQQNTTLFCFDHPIIQQSARSPEDAAKMMIANTIKLPHQRKPGAKLAITTRLSIFALLFNCNAVPTSRETEWLMDQLIGLGSQLAPKLTRTFADTMIKFAQDIGTEHLRSLQRFYTLLEVSEPNAPRSPIRVQGLATDLKLQYRRTFESGDFKNAKDSARKDNSTGVFELQVFPSHVELQGPIDPGPSSIIDAHKERIENFLRVRFVDNTRKPLKEESRANINAILKLRVSPILRNKSQPLKLAILLSDRYEFLGYTLSGLKKKKCVWFFCKRKKSDWNAEKIRHHIGDWSVRAKNPNADLAYDPSKWGARLSLAFTESIFVRALSPHVNEFVVRPDTPTDSKLKNTDGCGIVTAELGEAINHALEQNGFAPSRAFQIRFGGAKGVVYIGSRLLFDNVDMNRITYDNAEMNNWNRKLYPHLAPDQNPDQYDDYAKTKPSALGVDSSKVQLILRESQQKFEPTLSGHSHKIHLRVVSTVSDDHQSLFFDAALKAFEDLGANTGEIEQIFRDTYDLLTTNSPERLDILHQIFRLPDDERETGVKSRYMLLQLARRLAKDPFAVRPEHYNNSFLHLYLAQLSERAFRKNPFQIPIPESCNVLGLTDDYQVLQPGEVFVRARGHTMHGRVYVYRDPIIHIGDIQTATAVNEGQLREHMNRDQRAHQDEVIGALHDMDNVVFFSQQDRPPLPNQLSGGDLDGDRFEIIPDGCRIWRGANCQPREPARYDDNDHAANAKEPFDINAVARFIVEYIGNDCFDVLQNNLVCLADQRQTGLNDNDVKGMAIWLSRAVDCAKSGVMVNLTRDVLQERAFQLRAKPDFLQASTSGRIAYRYFRGEYYESNHLLGRLYRYCKGLRYDTPQNVAVDNTYMRARVEMVWWTWFHDEWDRNQGDKALVGYLKDLHVNGGIYAMRRDDVDPDYDWIKDFVIEERNQYMEFRDRETVSGNFELDLFLGKKLRDFPERFINNLINKISKTLSSEGYVEFTDKNLDKVVCLGTITREALVLLYKRCLFIAWDIAIEESRRSRNHGQGYAYICLYALICHNLPIAGPIAGR